MIPVRPFPRCRRGRRLRCVSVSAPLPSTRASSSTAVGARSVVIRAVVDIVSVYRLPDSQVIQMGGEQHRGLLQDRIAAAQNAHRIPGVFLLAGGRAIEGQRCVRRQRFEDGRSFGTGLQQVEIASQTGGVFTFDFTGSAGNCLGALRELSGAFRAGSDDRCYRSFSGQRRCLGSLPPRSFPRISTMAPSTWGASSSRSSRARVRRSVSARDKQPRTLCQKSRLLSLRRRRVA